MFLTGDKWRVVRTTSTPAFSSSKIKLMNMPFIEATKDFVADIKKSIRSRGRNGKLEKFPIDE